MTAPAGPIGYDLVMAACRLPAGPDHRQPENAGWPEGFGRVLSSLRALSAARNGIWAGWTGDTDVHADPYPYHEQRMHPVPLSRREADDYFRGHCATTLAPLYQGCVAPPAFHRRWREAYRVVNRRFATTVAGLAAPDGLVWVHDYHLQLVPGFLRQLRPDLRIGWLLYGPFPPAELFLRLPSRKEIMASLLSADLVGFQHHRSAENFLDLARRMSVGPAGGDGCLHIGHRKVMVDTFPVTIDTTEVRRLAGDPQVRTRSAEIRAGMSNARTVFLSVGRLDQAEGIEQRLDAFAQLLANRRLDPTQTVFINVVTSNEDSVAARRVRDRVDRQVGQVNGLYARVGHPVVHHLHREMDSLELVALYLAADVLLATPLREDLALAAKEFAAARSDGGGWLVLSELAAATEIPTAIIVNPNDIDAVKGAMITAAARADSGTGVPVGNTGPQAGQGARHWAARVLVRPERARRMGTNTHEGDRAPRRHGCGQGGPDRSPGGRPGGSPANRLRQADRRLNPTTSPGPPADTLPSPGRRGPPAS